MKQTIILLALLAVGCRQEKHEIIDKFDDGHLFREEKGCSGEGMHYYHYTHSDHCPNPIHYSDTCKCK